MVAGGWAAAQMGAAARTEDGGVEAAGKVVELGAVKEANVVKEAVEKIDPARTCVSPQLLRFPDNAQQHPHSNFCGSTHQTARKSWGSGRLALRRR